MNVPEYCPICNGTIFETKIKPNKLYGNCLCCNFRFKFVDNELMRLDYGIGDIDIDISKDFDFINIWQDNKNKSGSKRIGAVQKCIFPKSLNKQDLINHIDRMLNLNIYS